MSGMEKKQLLHRYVLQVVKDATANLENESSNTAGLEVIASFYRGSIDPSYKLALTLIRPII